ncbi:MAG: hypothetical protein J1F07_03520 [Muribaculaceae bacterium]|nr:hypothetical protein [Muribaculaceae bacterium]
MKKLLFLLFLIVSGFSMANAQAPSISSLIKAIQQTTATNAKPVADMLETNGYTYRFRLDEPDYGYGKSTIFVYSKNCKVVHEEYSNGIEYTPVPEAANASIIVLRSIGSNIKYIDVQVYSNAAFKTWVSQLKALGYQTTSDGGSGNHGRDWQYVSRGKPNIGIWNDYSTTYVLTISK